MTPQELKNSILQLAIQGRLVEQRPEEGTAKELLREILKHGTTGTHRTTGTTRTTRTHGTGSRAPCRVSSVPSVSSVPVVPPVPPEEQPFDIPESWEWVRIADVWSVLNGDRGKNYPAKSTLSHTGIPFVSAVNLNGKSVVKDDDLLCLSDKQYERLGNGKLVRGDILVCIRGSLGKHGRYPFEKGAIASSLVIMRSRLELPALDDFLMLYLDSPLFFGEIKRYDNGTAQPNLAAKSLEQFLFPLPPLAEQKRIVAKIEELLPLIDRYERAWGKLEEFNRRFPVDMQKSVLQMAIQGKLVEQRPEEGTGEELYRQIQAERQRLVKAGKIKKEKSLPEITEDEIPFEIPESWLWTRLGEISWYFDAGKSPSCLKQPVKNKEWGVITTTSIQLGFFDDSQNKVLPDGFPVNKAMQVRLEDILITRAGPMSRTGVACLVKDIRYNLILSDKTVRINMTNSHVDKDYVVMVLNSPQIRQLIINLMSGMDKQQVNISQDKFKTVLIPLPPLAEQKRIVAKLEEILPLCERLKSCIVKGFAE